MPATTPEELQQWLDEPEGSRLEFKEAKQHFDFEKLVHYCVAIANEGGGKVILGVTDRRPRRVVGTQAFAEPGRTESGLHERLSHRVPVEEVQTDDGRVLVVHVPARLPGTAWQDKGQYLKRAGDGLVGMPADELRSIFSETGPDFSAQVCPGATLEDLAAEAIGEFRTRWAARERDDRRLRWPAVQILTDSELLVDGGITYAALVLLGTRAALSRLLGQAEVVFEYRSSEAPVPRPIGSSFAKAFSFCRMRSGRRSISATIARVTRTVCSDSSFRRSTRCLSVRRSSMRSLTGTIGWVARCSSGSTRVGSRWSAPVDFRPVSLPRTC